MCIVVKNEIEKVVTAFSSKISYEIFSNILPVVCFVLMFMAICFLIGKVVLGTGTHNMKKAAACMSCALLTVFVYRIFGLTVVDRKQLEVMDYQYHEGDHSITLQLKDEADKEYSQSFILPSGEKDSSELFMLDRVNTDGDGEYLQVERRYNGNYVYTLTCEKGKAMNEVILDHYDKIEMLGTGKVHSEKSHAPSYRTPWFYGIYGILY